MKERGRKWSGGVEGNEGEERDRGMRERRGTGERVEGVGEMKGVIGNI